MERSYNIQFAKKYGIKCAVMMKYFYYWIEKNVANGKNFEDDRYWTYNSISAFKDIFIEMSEKTIRGVIKKLEENELIIKGNFNKINYDRTTWYSITEKGYAELGINLPKGQMDMPKRANRSDRKGEPIPNNNTNNKHTIPQPQKQPPSPLAIELSTLTLNKAVEHGYKLSSITNKEINNGATFVDKLINTLTKSKHTQKEAEQITRQIITFAVTDVSNNGEFCWSKNFRSCGSLFTKSKANGQAKWENIYASMNKQPKKEVKQYYPTIGR